MLPNMKKIFIHNSRSSSRSLSLSLPRTHAYSWHTRVCMFVWTSLWGRRKRKKKKTAKQPQKQNCKQTNCKSFSIFILILSTISSKKHLANLWGGGTSQQSASQQSEMAKERNGHEIQRYLFCIRRAGAKQEWRQKTAHFPNVVRYIFLQFHPIQFATVCAEPRVYMCVCVCKFLGSGTWHNTSDFPTHSHSLSAQFNSLTHYFSLFYLQTLREFPEELRGDVSMHLHREILQLPIFEAASQVCIWISMRVTERAMLTYVCVCVSLPCAFRVISSSSL